MRCGDCGSRNLVRANAKGRRFGYMKWDDLELKVDLDLLTCQDCTNVLLEYGDAEKLDEALKRSLEMPTKVEVKKLSTRFQVVRDGTGYKVRYRSLFGWRWLTDANRRGRLVVTYFQNIEDAREAGERYAQLQEEIKQKKTKGMEVVYDSHKDK